MVYSATDIKVPQYLVCMGVARVFEMFIISSLTAVVFTVSMVNQFNNRSSDYNINKTIIVVLVIGNGSIIRFSPHLLTISKLQLIIQKLLLYERQ